jgi:excisionase family DNA binding protein
VGELIELTGWISAEQAADLLGCSVKYIYRIRKYLPPERIGRTLLYRRDAVERYALMHPNLGRMIRTNTA